jgi:CubicO group peptidase (beta-lactamase class C family)
MTHLHLSDQDTLCAVRRVLPAGALRRERCAARPLIWLAILTAAAVSAQQPAQDAADPVPQSVDAFRASAARVIEETGVAGAGLALVRQGGVEWEGGVGYADRDRQTPITASTNFRVGSISKTFVAIGLVQLSEDGLLDLDAPVRDVLPDLAIDNPWEDTHPVRVIHLLQHTAGFDDMHFNEMYVPSGEAERSLADVLHLNPNSRRVRWQPGTRMAYSNPGYGVAGLILETIAGMPYEEYIEREIFTPLAMTSSSFRLTPADESRLARGYTGVQGPPVGYRQIYLRPAGNMHSSPHDMARFVQMLLGWGELGSAFVVDPEYLGNMEQPRTTVASEAGLRNGYGSGIFTRVDLPFKVLGHDGGIDGFISSYAYSPSRDVGYVVLLNSTGPRAGEAMRRLSRMAIGYLKRDVAAPPRPDVAVETSTLDRYVGYYHDANPRNQIAWPVQSLFSGRSVVRDGNMLYAQPLIGARVRLIPVSESAFRLDNEIDASRVFTTTADGVMVMAGGQLYAERVSRWRIDSLRIGLTIALLTIASVFLVAIVWVARWRRAQPRGFWELKVALLLCPLVTLMPAGGLAFTPMMEWGARNPGTMAVFLGSLAIPVLALVVAVFTLGAMREGASKRLTTYAGAVALAMGGLSLYLSNHGLLGLRLWLY